MAKAYELPKLGYDYGALSPFISEEQLQIHHEKHHMAYVKGANAGLAKLDDARKSSSEIDIKAVLKDLSWNVGGHVLHTYFWENIGPKAGGEPTGDIAGVIKDEFGDFERFKKEFTQAANSVEGSGWAALTWDQISERPLIMQIEKHNMNLYPKSGLLLVIDVFEHAYYIDYKNARPEFTANFWNIANWDCVNARLKDVK